MKTMEKTLEALATRKSNKLRYKEKEQATRKTCCVNTSTKRMLKKMRQESLRQDIIQESPLKERSMSIR